MDETIASIGPAHLKILERFQESGFEFVRYERFATYLAATKRGFVALLEPTADGWQVFGQPGYRFPEGIGMLVEDGEGKKFLFHQKVVQADSRLLAQFQDFKRELLELLTTPLGKKAQGKKGIG